MSLMIHHNRLGLVDAAVYQLDKAATEYDERLFLDKHRDTGEWCLYVLLERPQKPYPVFVLGDRLPTKDAFIQRLRESDTQRNDIREQVNKANEAHQASIDAKKREEIGKGAEAMEYILRKQGAIPNTKSYRKVVRT